MYSEPFLFILRFFTMPLSDIADFFIGRISWGEKSTEKGGHLKRLVGTGT